MGFSDVYRSVLKDYPDVLTVEEMVEEVCRLSSSI